jgi:hypothetical protein
MSLFTSGDNGTFDNTVDSNGNPPSDWNITKSADSIVRYTTDNPITGTGSMHCESRTILNDDYALATNDNIVQGNLDEGQFFDVDEMTQSDLDQFAIEMRFKSKGVLIDQIYQLFNGVSYGMNLVFDDDEIAFRNNYTVNDRDNLVASFTATNWNHIVVFFDEINTVKRIYLNGIKVAESLTNISVFNKGSFQALRMMTNNSANTINLNGYFRGLRIFTQHELTDTEVTNLYNSDPKEIQSIPVTLQSALKHECLMNQEQGRDVINTGTGSNFPLNPLTGGYTDQELQFGGGAWVDVSGIN